MSKIFNSLAKEAMLAAKNGEKEKQNALKNLKAKMLEWKTSKEGAVIVNLVECNTAKELYSAGYYASTGLENNYDVYDISGWGPDYGDPSSYLDTLVPGGYMIKCIGVY